MSKIKLIRLGACCLLLVVGFVSQAHATPTPVSYSTTGLGPIYFGKDTFSLSGQSGTLSLNTTLSVIQGINTYTFNVAYEAGVAEETLTLFYNLTLDGVTHTLSQSATWNITPPGDSLFVLASAPVLFVTGDGSWDVTLNTYTTFNQLGSESASTLATFSPVPPTTPEPASMMLFGTGLLLIGGMVRAGARRRRRSGTPL